ncbi:hypothetical protein Brsp07_03434 [Brucella sp. NBRC 14130]|uniref:hypothetical protein n=1 Tax=Brucella sp. NBRC 14130 TaxID=3075483 RepID=UPI0030B3D411
MTTVPDAAVEEKAALKFKDYLRVWMASEQSELGTRINDLRSKAFKSNSKEDREAYFEALSLSFQRGEIVVADALTAALPHLPGVGVKKLEWRKYRNGDAEAVTPFGEIYTAYVNGYWRITRNGKAGKFIKATGCEDVDAAKAGAQADYSARILSALEPSAARELALEEDFATIRVVIYCYEGDSAQAFEAQKALTKIENAIRALSSPDHADAGKVEGGGWLPIESAPDHEQGPFLVTNNPKALNAFGRPSHVWCVGSIHKEDDGSFCAFDGYRKIHDLKMFAVVSAPSQEVA